jgi:hypothetical protein
MGRHDSLLLFCNDSKMNASSTGISAKHSKSRVRHAASRPISPSNLGLSSETLKRLMLPLG